VPVRRDPEAIARLEREVGCADRPPQERRVLEEHYFEHRPFADIAAALRLTRGRVSQLHKRGIERLRDRLRNEAPTTAFEA